jgi:hypothetical protein
VITTPNNLNSLHIREEDVRNESLMVVSKNTDLQDHLQAVHDALDHLIALLNESTNPGSDAHTVQLFAIRLFNIGASALKLGLSGYYQQAFQLMRDVLELVNLLDLFRADRSKIAEWRLADNKILKKHFSPASVRTALDSFPDYKGQKAGRDRQYAIFSEHAAHATYRGFNLVAPNNQPRIGPFFDEKLLQAFLEDLGRHLSHVSLAVSTLLDANESTTVLAAKAAYISSLRGYHDKYIKPVADGDN